MAKLGSTGISDTAVQQATGVFSSTDWSILCTHNNINKWSRWKPIRSDKLELVDSDMATNDFGFFLRTNPEIASVNPVDIFANRTWPYLKPRGGDYNEPYRIADFRNYNSLAKSPFDFSIVGQNGYESTGMGNLIIVVLESTDADCEIHLADFTPLFDNVCVWGVLYRKVGETTINYVGWEDGDPLPMTRPVSGIGEFTIPVSPGDYDVCIVINKTNDQLYLVPESFRRVTVAITTNEEVTKVSGFYGFRKEGTKNLYSSMVLTNVDTISKSATYTARIYAHNSGGQIVATLFEAIDIPITIPVGTTAFPVGDDVYGNEGLVRDESGVGIGGSYSYVVTVLVAGFAGFPIDFTGTLSN